MRALTLAAAALAVALTGCTAGTSTSTSAAASTGPVTAPPSTGVAVPTGLTPAPSGSPEELDDGATGTVLPGSQLQLDAAAQAAATGAATKAMTLFARRQVSAQQWWQDLLPLLSGPAAQAYRGTDPANVPATKITGGATMQAGSVPMVARVSVPTDAGIYTVILSRTDARPQWLVERLVPPSTGN